MLKRGDRMIFMEAWARALAASAAIISDLDAPRVRIVAENAPDKPPDSNEDEEWRQWMLTCARWCVETLEKGELP